MEDMMRIAKLLERKKAGANAYRGSSAETIDIIATRSKMQTGGVAKGVMAAIRVAHMKGPHDITWLVLIDHASPYSVY